MANWAVKTSFESNDFHVNVFCVNLHDCELRIQGYCNFPFGGNSGEVTNISPMLIIKARGVNKYYLCICQEGFLKKDFGYNYVSFKKEISIQCGKKPI